VAKQTRSFKKADGEKTGQWNSEGKFKVSALKGTFRPFSLVTQGKVPSKNPLRKFRKDRADKPIPERRSICGRTAIFLGAKEPRLDTDWLKSNRRMKLIGDIIYKLQVTLASAMLSRALQNQALALKVGRGNVKTL
jgi:hypothetical protein